MSRERTRSKVNPGSKEESVKGLKRRFIELSYHIIEYKITYYRPELIAEGYRDQLTISDDAYDALEMEYLRLCRDLKYPNTLVHKEYAGIEGYKGDGMMEVDFTKPAVHLVLRKYGVKDWRDKI